MQLSFSPSSMLADSTMVPSPQPHCHPRTVRWCGHYSVSSQLSCQVVSCLCLVPLRLLSKIHLLAQLALTSCLRYRFPKKEWILLFSRAGVLPLPSCPGMTLLEVVKLQEDCCLWPGARMGMITGMRNSNPCEVCCIHRAHEHDPNPRLSFVPFWVSPLIVFPDSCPR